MVLINGLAHGLSKSILKTPHRQINNIKKLDFQYRGTLNISGGVARRKKKPVLLMVLMIKSLWFVMFVMLFVVETITISCDGFIVCFFQYGHKPISVIQWHCGCCVT